MLIKCVHVYLVKIEVGEKDVIRLETCKKCNGRAVVDVVKERQNRQYYSKEMCDECINGLLEVEVDEVKTEVKTVEAVAKRKYTKKR